VLPFPALLLLAARWYQMAKHANHSTQQLLVMQAHNVFYTLTAPGFCQHVPPLATAHLQLQEHQQALKQAVLMVMISQSQVQQQQLVDNSSPAARVLQHCVSGCSSSWSSLVNREVAWMLLTC
jgi:hypothetical protein